MELKRTNYKVSKNKLAKVIMVLVKTLPALKDNTANLVKKKLCFLVKMNTILWHLHLWIPLKRLIAKTIIIYFKDRKLSWVNKNRNWASDQDKPEITPHSMVRAPEFKIVMLKMIKKSLCKSKLKQSKFLSKLVAKWTET